MKIFNRIFRFKNNIAFDYKILIPVIILSVIGLIALKSTSIDTLGEHSVFYKQFIWIFVGMLIFILIQFMRNQLIYEFSYILYLVLISLLIITLFMPQINGSTRWIFLGSFQLQPSELGKIIFIIALSRFISDYKDTISNPQPSIISNVTAKAENKASKIKELLIKQITSRVNWRESIEYMINNGVNEFIEIGPGKVLTGLVRRINKDVNVFNINSIDDITNYISK